MKTIERRPEDAGRATMGSIPILRSGSCVEWEDYGEPKPGAEQQAICPPRGGDRSNRSAVTGNSLLRETERA